MFKLEDIVEGFIMIVSASLGLAYAVFLPQIAAYYDIVTPEQWIYFLLAMSVSLIAVVLLVYSILNSAWCYHQKDTVDVLDENRSQSAINKLVSVDKAHNAIRSAFPVAGIAIIAYLVAEPNLFGESYRLDGALELLVFLPPAALIVASLLRKAKDISLGTALLAKDRAFHAQRELVENRFGPSNDAKDGQTQRITG